MLRHMETFAGHPTFYKKAYRWWVEYARKLAVENKRLREALTAKGRHE